MTIAELWERFRGIGPLEDSELSTLYVALEDAEIAISSLDLPCYEMVTSDLCNKLYDIRLVQHARHCDAIYWANLRDSIRKDRKNN